MTPDGYSLGYAGGQVLVSGNPALLRGLLDLPGAAPLHQLSSSGKYRALIALSLPATRVSVLAAEAMASPTAVTDAYRQARREAMNPTPCMREAGIDLMPHQWEFVDFARERSGVINASEQGTGKTRAAWALWHAWQPRRTVIVTPKSLCPQWLEEYRRTLPMPQRMDVLLASLYSRSIAERRQSLKSLTGQPGRSFVILNYEVLVQLLPELTRYQPECLIFDESWRLKTPRAAVTRAAHKLADATAAKAMLLTGTPIGNHVGDLWSQLRVLGKEAMPDKFGPFLAAHAVMVPVAFNGRQILKPKDVMNVTGLIRKLEPYWFRVTKEGVLDLPPKQQHLITLPFPPATKALYRRVQKEGTAALGAEGALDSEGSLMIRLQQIAGGHQPMPDDARGHGWRVEPLPCPKLAWLEEFTRDHLAGNPAARMLVWCRFVPEATRVAAALSKLLNHKVALCIGKTDAATLEAAKESYNSRDLDGVQVLVCQYQKMAFGHNLQATDYGVYFSPTWSYVERVQSEDRAHRHGREGTVQYFDLLIGASIDQDAHKAILRKENLAGKVSPET